MADHISQSNECFHCGLPVPKGIKYSVEINNQPRAMCCIGCESVAKAIVDNNLESFYSFRTNKSSKQEDLIPAELRQLDIYDDDALQKTFVWHEQNDSGLAIREASLILEGIVCAACVWLNEHHVKQLAGVIEFRINYSTHRASLKWDNSQIQLSQILKEITSIGYQAHPFDPGRMETLQKKEKNISLRRIAVAGVGMMQVMMTALALYIGEVSDMDSGMTQLLRWIGLIITTPVVFYSSRVFFTAAWRDIKRRQLGMDVPVAIAIGAAYLSSVWATVTNTGAVYFDSVTMFTFFLLIGRFLEMGARHRSGQVADELIRLLPVTATCIDDNNEQTLVAVNELELGDTLLVKPGEVIPADGTIIEGKSSVNESLLTGESLPIRKAQKNTVTGGTHNIESPLTMRVDKLGDSTVLSSIVRLLERAQSEKPSLARFADRFAAWFVGIMLIIAISVFAFWWFYEPSKAFWVTLSVLVVTCPCALSLATPAALTTATGALTEKGVLTTRGHALETLAKITHIFFDKTGTLTHGNIVVSDIQLFSDQSKQQCQQLAAGLEAASEHPIAKALIEDIDNKISFQQSIAESGRGIEGIFEGEKYRVGTAEYVAEIAGTAENELLTENNLSSVYLVKQSQWLAKFSLEDELREEASQAIKDLQAMGIKVTLLSGDKQNVVDTIANKLGIQQALGELLPEQKLKHLQQSQKNNEIVAMIGDGVNDAPVLASAQVSIAMGGGSQLAQVSADMVLLSENLSLLPEAIQTAKDMQSVIRQNFAWAILYNLLAIPLAATAMLAPWMAALGMSFSSLVVVLNALRLKN